MTAFYDALVTAEGVEAKEWEQLQYFEGCLPIEELARRGRDTPRFGPMKPVGLRDPRTGQDAARGGAVALRESARGLLQPGGISEPLEVRRAGAGAAADSGARECALSALRADPSQYLYQSRRGCWMQTLAMREHPRLLFAGQISGVEGYTESMATGMLAGLYAARRAHGLPVTPVPRGTALGSLVNYITRAELKHFQPANITFDLLEPLEEETRRKVRDKRERHRLQCERALAAFDAWWSEQTTPVAV